MATWTVHTWDGSAWNSDGTINRPNDVVTEEVVSNQTRLTLSNGDDAYMTPETYAVKNRISIQWFYKSTTLKDKVIAYMNAHSYVKITTHISGKTFIGRFISCRPTWLVGQDPDKWDIDATMEIME